MLFKKFYHNFVNEKDKNLNWKNTNYFFIVSILILIAWIILYQDFIYDSISNFYIDNIYVKVHWDQFGGVELTAWQMVGKLLLASILQSAHANLSIIILLPASLYLERKYGSFKFLIILLIVVPLSNLSYFAYETWDSLWAGSRLSTVSFFVFALFLIEFLFSLKRFKTHKFEIIYPLLVILIGVLFMCITDTSFKGFTALERLLYPEHFIPFLAGLMFAIALQIPKIGTKKRKKQ